MKNSKNIYKIKYLKYVKVDDKTDHHWNILNDSSPFKVYLAESTWTLVSCPCLDVLHCVKSVQIRSYFWPHFPVFGLNTEIHGFDTFHAVEYC